MKNLNSQIGKRETEKEEVIGHYQNEKKKEWKRRASGRILLRKTSPR